MIAFKNFRAAKGIFGSKWADPWYKYFDQYNKIKDSEYTDANGNTLSANDKYNEVYKMVEDADDLSREQKELLHEQLKISQGFTVKDTKFEKMVDSGMDTDYAMKLNNKWSAAQDELDEGDTLSNTEKASFIWNDPDIDANQKLVYLDQSGIVPKQTEFAKWLSANVDHATAVEYWNKIGSKGKPNPWKKSYDYVLKHPGK